MEPLRLFTRALVIANYLGFKPSTFTAVIRLAFFRVKQAGVRAISTNSTLSGALQSRDRRRPGVTRGARRWASSALPSPARPPRLRFPRSANLCTSFSTTNGPKSSSLAPRRSMRCARSAATSACSRCAGARVRARATSSTSCAAPGTTRDSRWVPPSGRAPRGCGSGPRPSGAWTRSPERRSTSCSWTPRASTRTTRRASTARKSSPWPCCYRPCSATTRWAASTKPRSIASPSSPR